MQSKIDKMPCSTLAARSNISEVGPWRTAAANLLYVNRMLGLNSADPACQATLQKYVQTAITQPGLEALARAHPRLKASEPKRLGYSAAAQIAWAVNGEFAAASITTAHRRACCHPG